MFCKNCGKQISDTAKFCPSCGKIVGIVVNGTASGSMQSVAGGSITLLKRKKIVKIAGITIAVILALSVILNFFSNPIDSALDRFESAIVKMEKLYVKSSSGKISQIEYLSEYQKIMKDLEEMEALFDGYDESDLTAQQWNRLIELVKRCSALYSYSYY